MIKVMIVDDHIVVREGLKQLIGLEDDIEVIAEADNGLECLNLLEKTSPDLIFMDVRMPGISGIETSRLICQKYPHIKIVMLTIYEDDKYVAEALQAGAKGYILKKVNRDELTKVIHHVMEGQAFLDPAVTAAVVNRFKPRTMSFKEGERAQLTQRELEVLKCMVAGYTDRKIGESLFISEHTVRTHIKSLYRKLGVSSKSRAVAKAIQDGLIIGYGSK
ncbi:MAG: response regulator transcription factor [Syntrophaceae bacterium]|nr:response regulator transcription factor [Syntrophaceae bacterium]